MGVLARWQSPSVVSRVNIEIDSWVESEGRRGELQSGGFVVSKCFDRQAEHMQFLVKFVHFLVACC